MNECVDRKMIKSMILMMMMVMLICDSVMSFHSNHFVPAITIKKVVRSNSNDVLQCVNNDDASNKDGYYFTNDDEMISGKSKQKSGGLDMKRFIGFNLLAILLAIGANFIGITSVLLSSTNPDYFKSLKLDQIYSINSYLRTVNDDYMYIYPDNWIADQRLQLMAAANRELPQTLQRKQQVIPSSARQKSGSLGRLENVSVIKSKLLPGFTLQGTLGTPTEAAEKLLKSAAPTPKEATLISAQQETRKGQLYYVYEYLVKKPDTNFNQHILSIITSRDSNLYTFTVQAPNNEWESEKETIIKIANSFEII